MLHGAGVGDMAMPLDAGSDLAVDAAVPRDLTADAAKPIVDMTGDAATVIDAAVPDLAVPDTAVAVDQAVPDLAVEDAPPDLALADAPPDLAVLCGVPGLACCIPLAGTSYCVAGCCTAGNICASGNQPAACGSGGACLDCTANPGGHGCVASGGVNVCGCTVATDCPSLMACSLASHLCNTACGAGTTICSTGCCSQGACVAGTASNACGATVGATCADCTSAPAGHACINGAACGCGSVQDCPVGSSCDSMSHTCTTTCDGSRLCNGGCCDLTGGTCVAGNTNALCGSTGSLCITCGFGRPTCSQGACTNTCTVGGSAPCGAGFCCDATNVCRVLSATSCGPLGGACVDCTRVAAAGQQCLPTGLCGCTNASDCPVGEACANGGCSTACSTQSACNGSCCNAGTCDPGTSSASCGPPGGACANCAMGGQGLACINGACACATSADCPRYQACDPNAHQCTMQCSASAPCNGGCCSTAGLCTAGTSMGACGASGATCLDCTVEEQAGRAGKTCIAVAGGGVCGCTDSTQCPATSAGCGATMTCAFTCDATRPCMSGCCDGFGCRPGTDNFFCGASGACADCAAAGAGHVCLPSRQCGCNTAADCPVGLACDTSAHVCGPSCLDATHTACNGGGSCCDLGGHSCVTGGTTTYCGLDGSACANCNLASTGVACIGGTTCGCNAVTDCPSLTTCNISTHVCESVCGDASHTGCNGGCCGGGLCQPGTANSNCGPIGGACVPCSGITPTCQAGVCTGACGGANQGNCPSGYCCQNGTCVAGTSTSACGSASACSDCTTSPAGAVCAQDASGSHCGCNSEGDCAPGYSCDPANHVCTTLCNAAGFQLCHGGCCSLAGTCVPGTAAVACGNSGDSCVSCAGNTTGTACVNSALGACGCHSQADCPIGMACNLVTLGCETRCSGPNYSPCNGGCCTSTGSCAAGTSQTACGIDGGQCTSCVGNPVGTLCSAGKCICNTRANCIPYYACDNIAHSCTTVCNINQFCNGGCCLNGNCINGTTGSTTCGNSGGACTVCVGKTCTPKGLCCGSVGAGCTAKSDCCGTEICANLSCQ
jgi:hypothetical protein